MVGEVLRDSTSASSRNLWTPIRDWKAALTRFTIQPGDRINRL